MLQKTLVALLAATSLAFAATPASAQVFGSKLNHEPTSTEQCNDGAGKARNMCTWVMTIAQQNVGKEPAPKDGTIRILRIRACSPGGSFVLQLARLNADGSKARVMRTGPAIVYKGSANCNQVETFNVNVPVRRGEHLAVVASQLNFIYNASGDGTHVFDPLLPDGGGFRNPSNSASGAGMLLLQAQYGPAN
jgi:hypothetical protein